MTGERASPTEVCPFSFIFAWTTATTRSASVGDPVSQRVAVSRSEIVESAKIVSNP